MHGRAVPVPGQRVGGRALADDPVAARQAIAPALNSERKWLDPLEAEALLRAYRIDVPEVVLVRNAEEAGTKAEALLARYPALVAKILSPDIVHKSDVAGVRLKLATPAAVRAAVSDILASATGGNGATGGDAYGGSAQL